MKASDELKNVDLHGGSKLGKGGMASKIAAAELCRQHNVDVVIADGNDPLDDPRHTCREGPGYLFRE